MQLQVRNLAWRQLTGIGTFEWRLHKKNNVEGISDHLSIQIYRNSSEILFEYSVYNSLPGLFFSNLLRAPNNVAIYDKDDNLSFSELAEVSLHVANVMRVLGCKPEDCVGLFVEPSLEQMIGLWGIIFSGAAYLPLPPDSPRERLEYMVHDASVKIIFTQQHLRDKLQSIESNKDIKIVTLEDICSFSKSEEAMIFTPIIQLRPENLAYIVYTSGSTGNPKGVLIEHRSVVNQMQWLVEKKYIGFDKTIIHKTPIGFDAAQWEMLTVCSGSKLFVSRFGLNKDLAKLLNEIIEHNVTLLQCVPTLLQAAVKKAQFSNCISLSHILCGAESLTKKLVTRCMDILPGCLIVNLYGPAECTCNASFYEILPNVFCNDDITGVPIGNPVNNVEFHLLNESGTLVPNGVIGELHISGVQISRGYLNLEQLTKNNFNSYQKELDLKSSTLYKTGDLAYIDNDGRYNFCGRIDAQVKVRGMRVELEEIKVVLENSLYVETTVVITHEVDGLNDYLLAYVKLSSRGIKLKDTVGDLELEIIIRKELENKLPNYMIPSFFVLSETIPLTSSGKVDVNKIKDLVKKHHKKNISGPRNETENIVLEIFKSTLEIEMVSIYDNFNTLGGDSMSAVDLVLSINEKFNIELPIHTIIESPTIESISKIINEKNLKTPSRVVCLQSNGNNRPIFCWPGLGGYPLSLNLLAHRLGKNQPFYGIQAYGINTQEKPYTSIEKMVAADIMEIRQIQEQGPYTLWGYSFGTTLAIEAALQLEKIGIEVEELVLIAPGIPQDVKMENHRNSFDNKELVKLLYSVFSKNKDHEGLRNCLLSAKDENSFATFICKHFNISSISLVIKITKVIIESLFASHKWLNTGPMTVDAAALILPAYNDEISIYERNIVHFRKGMEIKKLRATHFDTLEDRGLDEILSKLNR